eukprot:9475727-Pyramimonas_sp.AAC.1
MSCGRKMWHGDSITSSARGARHLTFAISGAGNGLFFKYFAVRALCTLPGFVPQDPIPAMFEISSGP